MQLSTRGVFRLALVVAFLGSFCGHAAAQSGPCSTAPLKIAINSNGWVCIPVESDYALIDPIPGLPQGRPRVVSISFLMFDPTKTNTATDAPTTTLDLGKPAQNPVGSVWVNVPAVTQIPLNQVWKARTVMIGQPDLAGVLQVSARSPESDPFARAAAAPAPVAPSRAPRLPEF